MIHAMIVDDEQIILDNLTYIFEQLEDAAVQKAFQDPAAALREYPALRPDVVIMDINMPTMNGLEFAEKIREIDPDANIIFLTAYDNYAVNAFGVNALDYLLKPVTTSKLTRALQRIRQRPGGTGQAAVSAPGAASTGGNASMGAKAEMAASASTDGKTSPGGRAETAASASTGGNASTGARAEAAASASTGDNASMGTGASMAAGTIVTAAEPAAAIPGRPFRIPGMLNNRICLIDPAEALYISVNQRVVSLHAAGHEYQLKQTISYWEGILAPYGWFRCHRLFLINMSQISEVSLMFNNTYDIRMKGCSDIISVSRTYAAAFKNYLNI